MHPTACNKGKELIVLDVVHTPIDDELSSGSSLSLSLSLAKDTRGSTKTKSRKRPSHHPTFSNAVSGAFRRVRREVGRRQNQLVQELENASVLPEGKMPLVLPAGTMDATNASCTSCLWYRASVLYVACSLNSQTR